MGPPREVVVISSDDDDDDEGSGRWAVSPGTLGWIAKFDDALAPVPRKKMGKGGGDPVGKDDSDDDDDDDDDDDCVVLDGDPHRPVAVAGAKGRRAVDAAADEVEIVAVKGEIACKDFPHSRHVCSEFPFGTTSHMKHCGMCYCFVCDAPAPCKYWGKGLSNDDHCHATDKETKWKTLRQAFKCKTLPATYSEKNENVVYPSTPSPRLSIQHPSAPSRRLSTQHPSTPSPRLSTQHPSTPLPRQHPSTPSPRLSTQHPSTPLPRQHPSTPSPRQQDFSHSRHLCPDLPFSTTSHAKHCSMCYCFVCDAPAPCKYWGKGLSHNDHCHATDKEAKWKTLRQAFKCKKQPATYPEKHENVVYPSTPSPRLPRQHPSTPSPRLSRQQEYYEEYTPEEYRVDDEEEYFDSDEEATVCVGNLPYGINSEYLGQLFGYAGIVVFSEIIYDKETGQSCGYGYVTMSTVQEAENAVKDYHLRELYGRLVTVSKAAAAASPSGGRGEETLSPCRSVSSSSKLYVGNLPWEVDGSALKQLFSEYGEVVHAKVIYHQGLGARRSRGFGFVTMATREGSEEAIWNLDKQVWRGRKLRVCVA